MQDTTAAIHFENVRQVYGNIAALEGVTLTLHPGELTFLIGSSGAGKSTILRLVNAELAPSEGMLWVDGIAVHLLKGSAVADLRRRVGVVFQDYQLLPRLTALENVAFALHVSDLQMPRPEASSLAAAQLRSVGLGSRLDAYPGQLSGGQQQRLAIARALATKPQILLADEPTGNLDQATAEPIVELLAAIAATGTTVVVATHDLDIVRSTPARIVNMDRGRITSNPAPLAVRS